MSNGWAVRGLADPYFAFYQTSAVGMDGAANPPGAGGAEFDLQVEIALLALPQKAVSEDEIHPLFAYVAWGPPRVMLLGVGCTPSGRLVGLAPGGGVVQTAKGLLVPDGVTRKWDASYLRNTPSMFIQIDDQDAKSETPVPGGFPAPAVGDVGKFVLFNGDALASRCACRIRKATYGGEDGSITWALDEGGGSKLAGQSEDFTTQDFTLEAATLNDLAADSPWGTPTNSDPRASFAWQIATDYTRIPAPTTSYFGRVQV